MTTITITITYPDTVDEDALDEVLNALDNNSVPYEWVESD